VGLIKDVGACPPPHDLLVLFSSLCQYGDNFEGMKKCFQIGNGHVIVEECEKLIEIEVRIALDVGCI
jgi:hypothetical protein